MIMTMVKEEKTARTYAGKCWVAEEETEESPAILKYSILQFTSQAMAIQRQ